MHAEDRVFCVGYRVEQGDIIAQAPHRNREFLHLCSGASERERRHHKIELALVRAGP